MELLKGQRPRIQILDECTINQVAAGEVIESPASVIKELVENSIDAGATEISVEIISGGRNLITVKDNGCGMLKDDALLAFERHATSKIRKVDDLDQIGTMGFRGEALPSIASVAKCSLKTTTDAEDMGSKVVIHGGKMLVCETHIGSPGTEIEVRSLFYNVPVRRKFQKSVSKDIQSVIQVMTHLALANPHCKFSLKSEGKNVFNVRATYKDVIEKTYKERVYELLGDRYFSADYFFHLNEGEFSAYGLLSDPMQTRGSRTGQHTFINGRAIFSSFISKAIKDAYGTRIPTHKYPLFLLHLTLPSSYVDVNVHPQKREVRFREEEKIEAFLRKIVTKTLKQAAPSTDFQTFEEKPSLAFSSPSFAISQTSTQAPKKSDAPLPDFVPWEEDVFSAPEEKQEEKPQALTPVLPLVDIALHGRLGPFAFVESAYMREQLHNHINNEASWVLIHIGRARFRVFYDRLSQNEGKVEAQRLLIPVHLSLSRDEMDVFSKMLPELSDLGFSIREFGVNTLLVEEVPNFMARLSLDSWVKDLIHVKKGASIREDLKVKIALRASQIKESLSINELESLIRELVHLKEWVRTPLGKPIAQLMTAEDLKKRYFN